MHIIKMIFFQTAVKEVPDYENDISTEKKTQSKSPWLSGTDEYERRTQGFGCQKIKREKEIIRIRPHKLWSFLLCKRKALIRTAKTVWEFGNE